MCVNPAAKMKVTIEIKGLRELASWTLEREIEQERHQEREREREKERYRQPLWECAELCNANVNRLEDNA